MPNNGSGFLTGFTLGMVAGACGFYLYGTKQGAKVRGQIRDEFQKAYNAIPDAEKNAYPDSIRGSLKLMMDGILLDPAQKEQDKTKKKTKIPSTVPKTPKKASRFKNTK